MYSSPSQPSTAYSSITLHANTSKPIKQGWILKKSGPSFFTKWKPKYLVLLPASRDSPNANGFTPAVLQVFDQCDQSKPPKYQIFLKDIHAQAVDDYKSGFRNPFSRKATHVFAITCSSKKFYLATNTRIDRDEWIHLVKIQMGVDSWDYIHTKQMDAAYHSRANSSNPDSPRKIGKAYGIPFRSRMRTDDDAVSTYSAVTFDDSIKDTEDTKSIGSHMETLSFCSEPILTTDELEAIASQEKHVSIENVKRKQSESSPNQTHMSWNEKYQALLSMTIESDVQALLQDTQILELIGSFKEYASQRAQYIIDHYHTNAKIGDGEYDPCRFPFGFNDVCSIHEHNVVYRFACNYNETLPEDVPMFLSHSSHELKSTDVLTRAISSFDNPSQKIHAVLMTIIDYKGFRIIAHADTGIKDDHIIVDHMAESPKMDDELTDSLSSCCYQLNLKSHTVQLNKGRRISIATPIDLELYKNNSNQIFLANTVNLMPLDNYSDENTNSFDNEKEITIQESEIDSTKRFRPEFLLCYNSPISCDSLTSYSAATTKEKELHDLDAIKASKFLRECWIPGFVCRLDQLIVRPVDSHSLTVEMHRSGVNMRYLGMIAKLSSLPHIRNLACIEMVARTVKHVFNTKLRCAILNFKSVGATQIDDKMKSYASLTFSTILCKGDKSHRYFEDHLKPLIASKFEYKMDYKCFKELYRPCLFMAMQYHCGVHFEDSRDYDFESTAPIPKSKFISFIPKVKTLSGLPRVIKLDQSKTTSRVSEVDDDEKLAYQLARYFKSIGPKSKLSKLETSAYALAKVAAHYFVKGRYEESNIYAQAAIKAASETSYLVGVAQAISFQCLAVFQPNTITLPDSHILKLYQESLQSVQWYLGPHHPLQMAVHDRLSALYLKSKNLEFALDAHLMSLEIAESTLGKTHSVTAGYLTRAGCLQFMLKRTDEAIESLTEALHIYEGLKADVSYIAEVHYYFAECLEERGDITKALHHAQTCKKFREKCFGLADSRSVDSFRQVARLLLSPYKDYNGVITPQIKKAYSEAILCLEKVFRYLKTVKATRKERRQEAAMKRSASVVTLTNQDTLRLPFDTDVTTHVQILGPLVKSPFGPCPAIPRSLLHQLTKQIIGLKLLLVEDPKHKDSIRMLRGKSLNLSQENDLDPVEAKAVILRLAAVSPSVYLDGILQRIEDEDDAAMEELKIVLMLTEQETVGMAI